MFQRQQQKGFSLPETMLAAFVLAIGMLAAVELFGPSVMNTRLNVNQILAADLVQEGLELMTNQRNQNMLDGNPLNHGFSGGTYCIDYNDASVGSCTSDGALAISGGWYVHGSGADTGFKRKIHTTSPTADEVVVTSYVVWQGGSFPSSLSDPSTCTLKNKCAFGRVVLTDWKL